jgi:hypothetical protein
MVDEKGNEGSHDRTYVRVVLFGRVIWFPRPLFVPSSLHSLSPEYEHLRLAGRFRYSYRYQVYAHL